MPLLFPLGLLVAILIVAIGMLPILALIFLYFGDWRGAAMLLGIWIVLLLACRIFRVRRWLEWPPSVP